MKKSGKLKVIPISAGFVHSFLIKESSYVLIDTGKQLSAEIILKKLESISVDPEEIRLIILTHGHTDHFGGCRTLKEKSGAKVLIHKNDLSGIRDGTNVDFKPNGMVANIFTKMGNSKPKGYQGIEPDILLEGEVALLEYGVNGRIIPTPGHTSGSISIILNDGSAFVGDLIMGGFIGKGKPQLPFFANDVQQIKDSIRYVVNQSPKKIYTAHGGPFTIDELKDSLLFLNW